MDRTMVAAIPPILTALIVAGVRIAGVKSEFFQAVAHLYVGGLIGAFVADRKLRLELWLAIALSVVEVACFFLLG